MLTNVRILVVAVACVALCPALSAADGSPVFAGMSAEAGDSGPVIHLLGSGDFDTVHYSPQPGVWIVEMPEGSWREDAALLSRPDLGIERAELERVQEFGKTVSRLTVWLAGPAQLDLVPAADGLELVFSSLFRAMGGSLAAPEEPVVVPGHDVDAAPADDPPAPVTPTAPSRPPVADGEVAANLLGIEVTRSRDRLEVSLAADGVLAARSFTLPAPDRLVLDLDGIVNRVDRRSIRVDSADVEQVRVAQFRSLPDPVTRVVLDLRRPVEYALEPTGTGARLTVFGDEGAGGAIAASDADQADEQRAAVLASMRQAPPEPIPEPPPEPLTASAAEEATVADGAGRRRAEVPPERSPWVADPSQLIETAPAAQALEPGAGESFATTEVESEEVQYTGEPISLQLKDADIKDVLRTFSTLTGLNIVLDPSVSGSVTVELRDVPWDQALDLILKINGLDYVLENNVLRVAPIGKLAQEKQARAQFEQQEEAAKPLKTILKPLSYAKASYVAGLLRGDSYLLSGRGSVTVDERTNTLIIRDTVDRVEGVLRLIDSLDQPAPQVVIEGRIVETTRDFSRELGISWGFSGVMDAEHGNTTGLEFPNTVNVDGDVGLARGNNGTLALSFGDILNTFNLDFLLTAAESDGVLKIVSTPRVTTQNLQQASIRSGLQIPVQTVANNTVTVQYVDATLRLEVTPQITAEGTVNLDIDIRKQEPVIAAAVTGGQNAPIFTRDARTQLLVRDGGTTVIAGIYQIDTQEQENRVPKLWKLPILGNLFKNRGDFSRHDELLIFITPRIVKY